MTWKKFSKLYTLLSLRFLTLLRASSSRSETYAGGRRNATIKQLKIAKTTLLPCKNSRKNFEQSVVLF